MDLHANEISFDEFLSLLVKLAISLPRFNDDANMWTPAQKLTMLMFRIDRGGKLFRDIMTAAQEIRREPTSLALTPNELLQDSANDVGAQLQRSDLGSGDRYADLDFGGGKEVVQLRDTSQSSVESKHADSDLWRVVRAVFDYYCAFGEVSLRG